MRIVTLDEIKAQLNIELDFEEDDALLTLYADAAEEEVEKHALISLGTLNPVPAIAKLAVLIRVTMYYDEDRGNYQVSGKYYTRSFEGLCNKLMSEYSTQTAV